MALVKGDYRCLVMLLAKCVRAPKPQNEKTVEEHEKRKNKMDFTKIQGTARWRCPKICIEKQKPRKNPRQKREKLLTNETICDKMVLHSVILCPYVAILNHEDMITQNMAVVKSKVKIISKTNN